MAVGGDIVEINFNHPTLGSGVLLPKANEASTYDLGGFRSDDDDNGVDGGGNTIRKMNQNRWSFEVPVSNDMRVKMELEKINAMAGNPDEATWTITHINGAIYVGVGAPVGPVKFNGNDTVFTLKVAGGGKLEKQA